MAEKREEKAEKLQKEAEARAQEFKEMLQRLQAEFENYRKRAEREKAEFAKYANAKLIEDFLPVLDSIGEAAKKSNDEGINLIKKQVDDFFHKRGLREIDACGKQFDTGLHECVMKGREEKKEGDIVLEEFQKGYMLNEKVLRTAKVKVNKKEAEKENENSSI